MKSITLENFRHHDDSKNFTHNSKREKSKMEENYYNKNSDFPKATTTNKQKPSTE